MHKVLVAGIVGLGLLAGCGLTANTSYLYKSKPVTLGEKNDHMFACKLEAAQAVPTDNVTSRTPTWTTPVSCNTIGTYTSCSGGQTYGGNLITNDRNQALRTEYENRCQAKKGYVRTSSPIPMCDGKRVKAANITMESIVHKPVEGACWTRGTENASIILLPEDQ